MRIFVTALLVLLGISMAVAVENQAFLGIFVETQTMKMVGMPEMPAMEGMPDMTALMGGQVPPGMAMMGPKRLFNVRLWSPNIAPKDATATLAIPKGLLLGKSLNLSLYRPEPETGTVTPGGTTPTTIPNMTIKRYWGSSATVKEGQPVIWSFKDMTPEQQAQMREAARSSDKASSYYYKPNWTTGYWPTDKQPGTVKKDAKLQGNYALSTNYTGNIAIDVPDTVNFLNPYKLQSPNFENAIPLQQAITFTWDAIPGVLGSYAQIIGMQGKETLIIWTSSEVRAEPEMSWDYLQMAEVLMYVKENKFMAPDRTEVIVPAGIFQDCDTVFFRMVGYGPGTALAEGQPLPRVQTKTTISAMLGGKMMENGMK